MPNKILRYAIAGLLVFGLIAVRMFETKLFYDPLLAFFKNSNHTILPQMDLIKLYTHVFFRYMINLFLTVIIVKILFWKQSYVKFTIIVGIIGFVLLLPIYAYMLNNNLNFGEMIFFYVRRFLIQPMFMIILIPCFYYQEIRNKKATLN
ncbi:exosortase F system-associated membrane protein [Faecalibacter macacae]|uniref:Exosortase F system-associated protein n=1 Tax=Faecalibacter macacae TaxID=1859289 RepID=A0A3L9MKT2_9FLAO|nr:exosortase F system-associated protein [Faecalibacter macacae]RLZ11884.1 exosortase F system-associated protein [Faecalibacter macacae]